MPAPQSRYFMLTIPFEDWSPPLELPDGVDWMCGQAEQGGTTGYKHWQFLAYFKSKCTCTKAKKSFPDSAHLEPTRSSAAEAYVLKQDTKIDGRFFRFQFE